MTLTERQKLTQDFANYIIEAMSQEDFVSFATDRIQDDLNELDEETFLNQLNVIAPFLRG